MNDAFESLLTYFLNNWPSLLWTLAVVVVGSSFAAQRARMRWKRSNFLNRLNVSLSSIEDGKLRIRTVLEKDCEEVFLNAVAARTVVKLAGKTTDRDPDPADA